MSNEASERSGLVSIVTGANSGLGLETALLLGSVSRESTVILACRDLERGAEARRNIESTTGNTRTVALRLDLSSMESVREFVARYRDTVTKPVDALICNAGVSGGTGPTIDGIDPVFATNHLGHFLLTVSLLGDMAADGRILSVSSDMHEPPGPRLRWPGAAALANPPSAAVTRRRYSYSKLCNLYFTYELARRLRAADSGIAAAAFNPGLMTETNFATIPRPIRAVMKRVFASRAGSLDSSSAALAQLAESHRHANSGRYFDRTSTTDARSSVLSYDRENALELWEFSERLTGTRY